MLLAKVLNMSGEYIGEAQLSDTIFGIKPNMPAMHSAVVHYMTNRRRGTKSALTRAEVSGGGRKPWRQKGTGHARQGSTRSPQWTHGGVVFAPKPREFNVSINKKLRRLAIKSAFSWKFLRDEIVVVDKLKLDSIKTKNMVNVLKNIGVSGKSLIVLPMVDEILIKSSRNIDKVLTSQVGNLNTYNLLYSGKLVIPISSLHKIEEVYT
jgi:large subunit ribosomal protein L4